DSTAMVGLVGAVARATRWCFLFDGEHLALSELQGHPPGTPSLAADHHSCCCPFLFDLDVSAAGVAGLVGAVCLDGHSNPCGWHHPAALQPPPPAATTGAPDWLTTLPSSAS